LPFDPAVLIEKVGVGVARLASAVQLSKSSVQIQQHQLLGVDCL
jgi:hypothetical protein